nr:tyrosine-protein phosphatase 10D-like [Procambarus clarkii]
MAAGGRHRPLLWRGSLLILWLQLFQCSSNNTTNRIGSETTTGAHTITGNVTTNGSLTTTGSVTSTVETNIEREEPRKTKPPRRDTTPSYPTKSVNLTVSEPKYGRFSGRIARVKWSSHTSEYIQYTLKTINYYVKSDTCSLKVQQYDDHYFPYNYPFYGNGHGYREIRKCDCQKEICTFTVELDPETTYKFELEGQKRGRGKSTFLADYSLNTTSGIPPRMNNIVDDYVAKDRIPESVRGLDYSTYCIIIREDLFDHSHGRISEYQIILAKKDDLAQEAFGLGTGTDPHYDPQYKNPEALYRVFPKDKYQGGRHIFVFGEDQWATCQDCNGPLVPNTVYYYKFRMFTKMGYGDSRIYSFRTQPWNFFQPPVVVLFVLLVLVSLTVAGYYSYRKVATNNLEERVPFDLSWMFQLDSLICMQRPVKVSELHQTLTALLANDQEMLAKEFEELKAVSPASTTNAASHPDNRPKNRYVNILPYDNSRVVLRELENIPCSDYINASYIHGYKIPKEFIASQGPKDNTTKDFWRMVWEKNIRVIVMVTQCTQMNKDKCSKYWPNPSEEPITYPVEKLIVHTLEEMPNLPGGYISRKMKLTKQGHGSRSVQQYQYIAWPDMGCPSTPDQLLSFVKTVKLSVPPKRSPILVHCSAGVGRTGTFIAVYCLMTEMEYSHSVDIFYCTLRMRVHRPNMVQTQEQYAFIYKSVLQHFESISGVKSDDINEPNCTAPKIPDIVSSVRGLPFECMAEDSCIDIPAEKYPDPPPFPAGYAESSSCDENCNLNT